MGTFGAVILYIVVGCFGYLTWVTYPLGPEVALED